MLASLQPCAVVVMETDASHTRQVCRREQRRLASSQAFALTPGHRAVARRRAEPASPATRGSPREDSFMPSPRLHWVAWVDAKSVA